MANIGDIQFFMKKQREGCDMSKCPRTKNYSKEVGGLLLSGVLAVACFTQAVNLAIDFFMKDLVVRPKKQNNNNNNR